MATATVAAQVSPCKLGEMLTLLMHEKRAEERMRRCICGQPCTHRSESCTSSSFDSSSSDSSDPSEYPLDPEPWETPSTYIPPLPIDRQTPLTEASTAARPYVEDEIRRAIENNDPVEEKLHVVIMVSNPCNFRKRHILAKEFIERMNRDERDIILYVCEVAYRDQPFLITTADNPRHLQVKMNAPPIWIKESALRAAVTYLVPKNFKAVAWLDADIAFESNTWASDALKVLNGSKDIVQLWSHAIDRNEDGSAMSVFSSFGFQYSNGRPPGNGTHNMWHPGFAWACTRKAWDMMDGIFDLSILGSGDMNSAQSLVGHGVESIRPECSDGYKRSIAEFQEKVRTLRLSYIPGVIQHYYHGQKIKRGYLERGKILVKHQYDPYVHTMRGPYGILVPTAACPKEFLDDIMAYFCQRDEDDSLRKK